MDDRKLRANEFLYREAVAEVERLRALGRRGVPEAIERAARIAWFYHAGRFADGALENRLLEAGRQIESLAGGRTGSGSPGRGGGARGAPRIVHVATEVYQTGGHTRLLAEWIRRDESVTHQLVLTQQREPLPGYLAELCTAREVEVMRLERDSPVLDRARILRDLAAEASGVALHHNPDDAVPIVAFSTQGGPAVVMCNHAHFSFSLGPSVSDLVLNTIPYYARVSEHHRFARRVEVIPMGAFGPQETPPVDKSAAKRELGFPEDRTVVLTIGNEAYYRPTRGMDFFETMEKLTARRPDFLLAFVGIGPDSELLPEWLRRSDRARFFGVVDDPTPYYRAADLCLESFPTPSLGAVSESVLIGAACPVYSYAERENILRPEMSARFPRSRGEAEYLDEVSHRMEHRAETAALVEAERDDLSGQAKRSADYWTSLDQRLLESEHRSSPIPSTRCESHYDNILLAHSGWEDVGDHLLGLCWDEPWRAFRTHLKAMSKGYEGYGRGVWRLARVAYRTVRRSLGVSYGVVRRLVRHGPARDAGVTL